jgi:hypothetical protein
MRNESTLWKIRLLAANREGRCRLTEKRKTQLRKEIERSVPEGCLFVWKEKSWSQS